MSHANQSANSSVETGNSASNVSSSISHSGILATTSTDVVGAKTKPTPSTSSTTSSPTPTANVNTPPSPLVIGKSFIKQYYQVLSTSPQLIPRFYQPNTSVLSHSFLSSVPAESKTLSPINHSDIFQWAVSSSKSNANDTTEASGRLCFDFGRGAIDAQETIQGGILLVVTGHMKLPDAVKTKAFVHTFLLNNGAPAGKKRQFYVHNDILRFIAESDVEETEEDENICTSPQKQRPQDSTPRNHGSAVATDGVTEESVVAEQDTNPNKTEKALKPAAQAQDIITPTDTPTDVEEKPPLRKGAHLKANVPTIDHSVKNGSTKTESKRKNANSSGNRSDTTPTTNVSKTSVDGGGGRKKNHEQSINNDVSSTPKEEKRSKKNKGKGGRSRKDRGRSPSSDQTDSNAANISNATNTSAKQRDSKRNNASSSSNKPKVPGSWAGVVAGAGAPGTTTPSTSTPSSPSRPSPAAAAAAATAAAHLTSNNSAAVEESKDGMDMDGLDKAGATNTSDGAPEASPSINNVNSKSGQPPRSNSSSNHQPIGNNITQRTPEATLFLKNISDKMKETDIRNIFEPYATTANKKILGITLHASRGFCFVDFDAKLVVDTILSDVEAVKEANKANGSNGEDSKFYIHGKLLEVGRKVQVDKGRGGGGSNRYRNRSASPGNGAYHKSRGGGHHHRRNSPRGGNRAAGSSHQQQQTQRTTTK